MTNCQRCLRRSSRHVLHVHEFCYHVPPAAPVHGNDYCHPASRTSKSARPSSSTLLQPQTTGATFPCVSEHQVYKSPPPRIQQLENDPTSHITHAPPSLHLISTSRLPPPGVIITYHPSPEPSNNELSCRGTLKLSAGAQTGHLRRRRAVPTARRARHSRR